MAERDASFRRCNICGIFFATHEAAKQHKCSKDQGTYESFTPNDNTKTMFQCETCRSFFDDMSTFQKHPCVCETERSNISIEDGSKGIMWNREQTLFLIQLYRDNIKQVEKGKIKKKKMWDTISINFKEQGYNFSTEQISGRWKSLLRAYKSTKDNNKKSGSSRKNFEYESEMDELFENDPTIEPEAVLSSGTVAAKRPADEDDEEGEVGTSSSSSTSTQQPAKKKSRSKSGELVTLFKSYLDEQKERDKEEKERREQMHRERLQVMNSLIAAISTHNRVNNQANQPPSRTWPRNEWDPTLP